MSLLDQIDKLREEAAELARVSNVGPLARPPELREKIRSDLREKETRIEQLLQAYHKLPLCPYPPCTGRMEPTPTKHVLQCTKCKALALPGGGCVSIVLGDPS